MLKSNLYLWYSYGTQIYLESLLGKKNEGFTSCARSSAGVEPTGPAIALCQALGVAVIGLAIISWTTASIAGDAINNYGRLFAYIHSAFAVLTLYQMMQDYFPNNQPNYINIAISVILAAAFFYYSRKTE